MHELKSGETVIGVRASNLARLYFTQRFGVDFDSVLKNDIQPGQSLAVAIDALYRVAWAMAKAENYYCRRSTPDYYQWREKLDAAGFDLSECINELMDEIEQGFTVTRTYGNGKASKDSGQTNNLPQLIISISLKMGMSLDEINELSTQTLIDIMHEYIGSDKDKKEVKRKATPEEAQAFFMR
jgi:hypothetical protein